MAYWKHTAEETERMVARALTSWGVKREVIAKEFGISGQMVGYVRRGVRHVKVCPDLPRWRSCEACGHWQQESCTLGFPDPEEVGDLIQAGTECSAWVEAQP